MCQSVSVSFVYVFMKASCKRQTAHGISFWLTALILFILLGAHVYLYAFTHKHTYTRRLKCVHARAAAMRNGCVYIDIIKFPKFALMPVGINRNRIDWGWMASIAAAAIATTITTIATKPEGSKNDTRRPSDIFLHIKISLNLMSKFIWWNCVVH